MGFCGALDPALQAGDIFVATAVATAGRHVEVCRPTHAAPHRSGVLASIDHVAQTAAEKKRLHNSGASAVEMEAAGIAARAAETGIPLFCIRSVTDLAADTFVTDFNRALRSDGHFDTIRILTSALRNPWQAFPELIRLRHCCHIATRTLGEFVVGCRF
jgi:nucleoside phosphorylase